MYFTHPQLKFNIRNLGLFFRKFSENKLKEKLAKFFPDKNIIFTDSGRSAFQLVLKELNLENSEMLVPVYICDIFLPTFKYYNIKPIFLDIEPKTFNIQIPEIEKRITPKTKSILVCHTYGLLNDMNKILEIAKKYNLKIIEDCAHAFGIKYQDKFLGNFGDCAFFSLPKFLPAVSGGMLIFDKTATVNFLFRSEQKFDLRISALIKFLRLFPCFATISELFRSERKTLSDSKLSCPKKSPKHSLKILNWYLDNLEEQISKRTELAEYFHEKLRKTGFQTSGITYISALVPKNINRDELFYKLRKRHIFCSRIWHQPIILDKNQYPNSYEAAERIINFPLQTWFTKKDIDKIISCILSSIG